MRILFGHIYPPLSVARYSFIHSESGAGQGFDQQGAPPPRQRGPGNVFAILDLVFSGPFAQVDDL